MQDIFYLFSKNVPFHLLPRLTDRRTEKVLQIQENNDPSEWVIFKNVHEPIIDQETFDIVQRIRDGRRRLIPMGEMPVLSGMLFCSDYGAKQYQVRARG
ncbi:recombinase family protein [Streptococcus sp.]